MSNRPHQFELGRKTSGPPWQRRRSAGRQLHHHGPRAVNERRRDERERAAEAGLSRKRYLRQLRRGRRLVFALRLRSGAAETAAATLADTLDPLTRRNRRG